MLLIKVTIDVSKELPKGIEKAALKSAKEQIYRKGIDITCPTCERSIRIKGQNPKCRHCGTNLKFRF